MGEMIGTLDERTLYAYLTLDSLEPVARAIWPMNGYATHPKHFTERHGENQGLVQLFAPGGPVIKYQRFNGGYSLELYSNGETKGQTQLLFDRINKFINETTSNY